MTDPFRRVNDAIDDTLDVLDEGLRRREFKRRVTIPSGREDDYRRRQESLDRHALSSEKKRRDEPRP